jgi:hypothetical protein
MLSLHRRRLLNRKNGVANIDWQLGETWHIRSGLPRQSSAAGRSGPARPLQSNADQILVRCGGAGYQQRYHAVDRPCCHLHLNS